MFSLFSHSVPLSGSMPATVRASRQLHHADASTRLEIVVGLKSRNDIELDGLIARQHDPDSPDYQRFLTVEEFTARFAPTQAQVDKVVTFLTASGITVEEVYDNRLLIRASGTVRQLESAFKVVINEYQVPGTAPAPVQASTQSVKSILPAPATYLSNDRDPSVPPELADIVQSVIGLDTLTVLHNHMAHDDSPQQLPPPGKPLDSPVQAPNPQPVSTNPPTNTAPVTTGTPIGTNPPDTAGQPPVGTTGQPPGTTAGTGNPPTTSQPPTTQPPVVSTPPLPIQTPLTPQQIATAYNFPNANNHNINARKYSGKGVNIAIATAEGYDQAEIELYWKTAGVHRTGTLTDINIGGKGKPGDETTLDLELAGAQAPGANILMYMAATPQLLMFTITYAKVVIENKADVMTSSWGLCEEGMGPRLMATQAIILREAAVQGIAIFVSAGDNGAFDCGPRAAKPVQAVDYPSSSPYVTAVGGTSLRMDKFARTSETVWKKGGGGVSKSIDMPLWQVAPTLPPGNFRATSDVSLDSDPRTGYMYLFKGKWENVGGTSAAAPTWAAFWSLVMQATGQRVGSAVFYVYRMGGLKDYNKLFYDVIQGDNGFGVGGGFNAGTGWDVPSGWGTPDGVAITNWMISVTPLKAPEDRRLGQTHPPAKPKPKPDPNPNPVQGPAQGPTQGTGTTQPTQGTGPTQNPVPSPLPSPAQHIAPSLQSLDPRHAPMK